MASCTFKWGVHQFLWKEQWTDADVSLLSKIRELGCSQLEVSLGDDVVFDPAHLRRHAEATGVELTVGPGNIWPAHCNISSDDPAQREAGMIWHRRILQRAAEMGAVAYCGALYSHPGHVLRRRPPAEELPRTAALLHTLAEDGQRLGVRLVIEPMSRFRLHLVNTAAQALTLARLVDHPNLFINLDTYHMICEERDYGAAIRSVLPMLWGLHACENDRGTPGGGLVPWQDVFRALSEAQGCLRMMFETYNTGDSGMGYSRGIFQNLCPDPEAFVRQGLAFMQAGLAPYQRKAL